MKVNSLSIKGRRLRIISEWKASFEDWQENPGRAPAGSPAIEDKSVLAFWNGVVHFFGVIITPFIMNPEFVCPIMGDMIGTLVVYEFGYMEFDFEEAYPKITQNIQEYTDRVPTDYYSFFAAAWDANCRKDFEL